MSRKTTGLLLSLVGLAAAIVLYVRFANRADGFEAMRSGDYANALRQLEPLAERGDAAAQYSLAVMYGDGRGVPKEDRAALRYLRLAGAQGHAGAEYALGLMYDTGRSVPRDYGEAFRWFRRAAERGEARAQYQLGLIYDKHRGVARDADAAARWYRLAAAQGHAAAQQALMALPRSREQADRLPGRPAFSVSRPSSPVVPDLDHLDRKAHELQAALASELGKPRDSLRGAFRAYLDAERAVTAARAAAWRAMPLSRGMPVLIAEPLALAMLDLHVELRRALGPTFHTTVPGLTKDRGCAGDLVEDRLIYDYGARVADSGARDSAETLDRIARQLVCLGRRQLSGLDGVMSKAFADVAGRMIESGRGRLAPAFARLVAPIEALILDARKHRGERSFAWRWFRSHRAELAGAIARAGWASGDVLYLWDRRRARLVGFRPCAPGHQASPCVNFPAFLESLADPRALALGDCALAGMIGHGLTRIAGQNRYACPPLSCGADAASSSGGRERRRVASLLAARWPSEARDGLVPERDDHGSPLCRDAADGALQGLPAAADECLAEIFDQSDNPWDTYAACTADAVGAGSEPVPLGGLPGVPMGPNCGLFGEGGGETPESPQPQTDAEVEEDPPPAAPEPEEPGLFDWLADWWDSTFGDGDDEVQLKVVKKEDGDLEITGGVDSKEDADKAAWGVLKAYADGKVDDELAFGLLEALHEKKKGLQDCVDPESCPNACTGVGTQVAEAQTCTDDLLGALAEAMGRPRPKLGERRPLGPVAIWDPDSAPVDESGSTACVAGDTGPGRGAPGICGLILCPDASGLAAPAADGCRCGNDVPAFDPSFRGCYAVDCPSGQLPGADCSCQPAEMPESEPGRPPVPVDVPPGPNDRGGRGDRPTRPPR